MNECNQTLPIRDQRHSATSRELASTGSVAGRLKEVEQEHNDLFIQFAAFNHAAVRSAGMARERLLKMFDALLRDLREHFRDEEALLEQTSWLLYQPHRALHVQLEAELDAYRGRLAGDETLDPVEGEHVLDGLLIHHIMERPMFDNLYAHTEQGSKQWVWSGAWYRGLEEKED